MTESCFYCTKDHQLEEKMIEICKLQTSTLYLNRDQTHQGRCIIALNQHKKELFHLNDSELASFMEEVAKTAKAIQTAFSAEKINYAIYGDLVSHLHFHLVPKQINGPQWGDAFINASQVPQVCTEDEYQQLILAIKKNIV